MADIARLEIATGVGLDTGYDWFWTQPLEMVKRRVWDNPLPEDPASERRCLACDRVFTPSGAWGYGNEFALAEHYEHPEKDDAYVGYTCPHCKAWNQFTETHTRGNWWCETCKLNANDPPPPGWEAPPPPTLKLRDPGLMLRVCRECYDGAAVLTARTGTPVED